MGTAKVNKLARELLVSNHSEVTRLARQLVADIAKELDLPPLSLDHKWPADILEVIREFLACVASNDLELIRVPGSIFEQLGRESARGGLEFDQLAAGIRLAGHRTQAAVYRALMADGAQETEAVLDLLGRVMTASEEIVTVAQRGYQIAGVADTEEDELLRRLGSVLICGRAGAAELAADAGWESDTYVCAVVASMSVAGEIRRRSDQRLAFFSREDDVVLIHPVPHDRLATTLRPVLADHACAVGPAVPLADLPSSLSLAQRSAVIAGSDQGPIFAADVLLELACVSDPSVVAALRRKHFAEIDRLPSDQRGVLLATLHEWLRQWGHRPGIAEALHVHPQTVSGRINRLKDLIADDLEDPRSRSELLVLLVAERVGQLDTD